MGVWENQAPSMAGIWEKAVMYLWKVPPEILEKLALLVTRKGLWRRKRREALVCGCLARCVLSVSGQGAPCAYSLA